MAERDNPLMYGGPSPKWKRIRTNVSVRCDPARGGCGTIHPGRFMTEVDPATGLCQRCAKAFMGMYSESPKMAVAEQQEDSRPVRLAWISLLALSGLGLAAWLLSGCTVPMQSYGYSNQSSQTVEFYDTSGRHTGYGKIQGGNIELFNPNSSRQGFGKMGR